MIPVFVGSIEQGLSLFEHMRGGITITAQINPFYFKRFNTSHSGIPLTIPKLVKSTKRLS